MTRVGIWEKQERVSEAVRRSLGRELGEIRLVSGRHPAEFAGEAVDLLCIGPDSDGWAGVRSAECDVILLPGAAGPLARGMRCRSAVSYGTSPRDTLTFSSLEGDKICLALQRELVSLAGHVVERQEFVVPFPLGEDPMTFLAAAGVLLLLGAKPEENCPFVRGVL